MSRAITQSRFFNEALEAHNRYRALHGCPPVELDEKLNQMAAEWAENLAANDKLYYRDTEYKKEPLGENILRANCVYFSGMKFIRVQVLVRFFIRSLLIEYKCL